MCFTSKEHFDKFVDELQKEIVNNEIKDFNEYIVELFHCPKNWGKPPVEDVSVSEKYKGSCGDTIEFFLKIENDVIQKANFYTDGCGATVAAGSQMTLLVEGKTIDFAKTIQPRDLDIALKGLPEDHKHCAELSVNAIKKAIEKYKMKIQEDLNID